MPTLRSAKPVRSPEPQRTITDITSDLQERALEHHSVALMLRAVFIALTERDSDLSRSSGDLWEGLAVVARHVSKDSLEISGMVDELRNQLDKDSAR